MAGCEAAHQELDSLANGELQTRALPKWTKLQGRAAWWVVRGPFDLLPARWPEFLAKVASEPARRPTGPAGDVYPCSPADHRADQGQKMLTILYVPIE
jgi:hypothetical protein